MSEHYWEHFTLYSYGLLRYAIYINMYISRIEVNLEKKDPLGNWPMLLANISSTNEGIPAIQQVNGHVMPFLACILTTYNGGLII